VITENQLKSCLTEAFLSGRIRDGDYIPFLGLEYLRVTLKLCRKRPMYGENEGDALGTDFGLTQSQNRLVS